MYYKDLSIVIAKAAISKKAYDIKIVDVTKIIDFTDVFIFMNGNSERHNRAIAECIEDHLYDIMGKHYCTIEGNKNGNWILLDYGNLVVNIMTSEMRNFYNLDELWHAGEEILLV